MLGSFRVNAEDLRAYRARFAAVEHRQRAERGTLTERLAQLAALMASVDALGWRATLSDDEPVWARWQRLRRAAGRAL
jgi:hypothetical protein